VDTGSFAGRAEAGCTVQVPPLTSVLAHTPNKRASYPLPSTKLASQPVPVRSVISFGAKGASAVGVEVGDAIDRFSNTPGVKVDWDPYKQCQQTWRWVLVPAKRAEPVVLEFATMWRTTATPSGVITCSADQQGRHAKVKTSGELPGSP
jgi:hypothetical protein